MHFGIRTGFPERNLGVLLGALLFFGALMAIVNGFGLGGALAGAAQIWSAIGIGKDSFGHSDGASYGKPCALFFLQGILFILIGSLILAGVNVLGR